MSSEYFQQLNKDLKSLPRSVPRVLIDLNILDRNIERLKSLLRPDLQFRIVVKSLPSPELIKYILSAVGGNNLMVFHLSFLSQIAEQGNKEMDILLGKPMPVINAKYFYTKFKGNHIFDQFQQIQWLVDTTERLQDYIQLAKELGEKIRINLELDVGLHRGGFTNLDALGEALKLIEEHQDFVVFSGFMGYDPHVVKLPKLIKSVQKAFQESNNQYANCIEYLKNGFPGLYKDDLTFNGGGSPSLALHTQGSVLNDIALGSALLKSTSFDIASLNNFEPAVFIATPILKKMKGVNVPGIEWASNIFGLTNINRNSYFIYGGFWKADYCYPEDAKENVFFGSSTNQSLVNSALDLAIEDYVFLRPHQSEFVLLQFGKILALRKGKVEGEWSIFSN